MSNEKDFDQLAALGARLDVRTGIVCHGLFLGLAHG